MASSALRPIWMAIWSAASDMRWADARLGTQRAEGAYAWRWFLDRGVPLAFGSDFPVEVVDPRWGLYAALTRQDRQGRPPGGWHPEQRMTRDEALKSMTIWPAYAAFMEHEAGSLSVGKRADFVVLDQDLMRVAPEQVLRTRVRSTWLGGEPVYQAD